MRRLRNGANHPRLALPRSPQSAPVMTRVSSASAGRSLKLRRLVDVLASYAPHDGGFALRLPGTYAIRLSRMGRSTDAIVDPVIRLLELMVHPEDADLFGPLVVDEIVLRLLRSLIGSRVAQIGQPSPECNGWPKPSPLIFMAFRGSQAQVNQLRQLSRTPSQSLRRARTPCRARDCGFLPGLPTPAPKGASQCPAPHERQRTQQVGANRQEFESQEGHSAQTFGDA